MFLLNLTFKESLNLMLMENLLIGGALLIVGIIIKGLVDRSNTRRSLEAELNKVRVEKIGECWAIHAKYIKYINDFTRKLGKYDSTEQSSSEKNETKSKLKAQLAGLTELKTELELVTASHKFWLGEEIYHESLKFIQSYPNFCKTFEDDNFKKCVELKENMDNNMMDVDDVLFMLNRKIRSRKRKRHSRKKA